MNETLKGVANIGAELGAALAENERLRGLLDGVRKLTKSQRMDNLVWSMHEGRIKAALSQQAEPVCDWPTCECALDPDKCKVQSVVPAPAQDEQPDDFYEDVYDQLCEMLEPHADRLGMPGPLPASVVESYGMLLEHFLNTRPAQTEQQQSGWKLVPVDLTQEMNDAGRKLLAQGSVPLSKVFRAILDAAPIAQTAPQPEQSGLVERWTAMSGDWRETSIAIHGERSGQIACGIPEDKAHAIIKAHNIGLPEECTALSATPSPAMDAKESDHE